MNKDLMGELIRAASRAHDAMEDFGSVYSFEMSKPFLNWLIRETDVTAITRINAHLSGVTKNFCGIPVYENKILPPGWAALVIRKDDKADQWFNLGD